jgi:glyoxylase-like metal-dependent hydrolase (beta-lactamase superfamily II)
MLHKLRSIAAPLTHWVLYSLWLTGLSVAAAQATATMPHMAAQQVSPHVWMVEGLSALGSSTNQNFISNAAFVITPDGVVVIDALGSPALAEQLLIEIKKVTEQPVTHVIVTHYHADHIYGLQTLKTAGGHIIAHSAAKDYLYSELAQQRLIDSRQTIAPWINNDTRLVPADEWITTSTTLTVGGMSLVVQPVGPSHTAEDMVVYIPQEKVLIAGDLVFRRRIPYVGQADSGHWIEALDSLLKFEATVVIPGHGPLSTAAREDMQLTRDYLRHLRAVMGPAAQTMEPFEDAYLAADWSRFEALPLFGVANRMNAYNTYLHMEREAK